MPLAAPSVYTVICLEELVKSGGLSFKKVAADFFVTGYTWKTPVLNFSVCGFWLAAVSASDISDLVSTGSMIASIHKRAAA